MENFRLCFRVACQFQRSSNLVDFTSGIKLSVESCQRLMYPAQVSAWHIPMSQCESEQPSCSPGQFYSQASVLMGQFNAINVSFDFSNIAWQYGRKQLLNSNAFPRVVEMSPRIHVVVFLNLGQGEFYKRKLIGRSAYAYRECGSWRERWEWSLMSTKLQPSWLLWKP